VPFRSIDEAIAVAAGSEYQLSLGDGGAAMRIADATPSGIVHIDRNVHREAVVDPAQVDRAVPLLVLPAAVARCGFTGNGAAQQP